jgi:hypothetical protein
MASPFHDPEGNDSEFDSSDSSLSFFSSTKDDLPQTNKKSVAAPVINFDEDLPSRPLEIDILRAKPIDSPDPEPTADTDKGKIKEFGKKARKLLQEEKDKRREIKILNQSEATKASNTKSKSISAPLSKKKKAVRPPTKRRKVVQKAKKSIESINKLDVSHMAVPEKDYRSNIVKLHGFRSNCTVEHVRKFFTGLQPESIFLLLSNRVYIRELDANRNPLSSNSVRIFVKFDSSATATLAAKRSGETIKISDDKLAPDKMKTISIGVTLVSKDVSRTLVGLSIPTSPGVHFDKTISNIQQKLHVMVPTILWQEAGKRLGFSVEKTTFNLFPFGDQNPSTFQGYQNLALHHNRLVQLHDEFFRHPPFPAVEVLFETNLSTTFSTVRLTSAASKVLANEMDRIEKLLYRSRVTARLGK